MTPDPTPHSLIHGAAGFCTDHAQAPDERTETVARLTEIVRVEMSKGAYQMLPDELPYESAARRVAAAVVAALDDESARLRDALTNARAVASDRIEDRERMLRDIMADRDAARAALDRVRALTDDRSRHGSATGWHSQVHTVVRLDALRAALDPEEPR